MIWPHAKPDIRIALKKSIKKERAGARECFSADWVWEELEEMSGGVKRVWRWRTKEEENKTNRVKFCRKSCYRVNFCRETVRQIIQQTHSQFQKEEPH